MRHLMRPVKGEYMQETVIKLGVVEVALSAQARWPVVAGLLGVRQ